MRTLRLTGMIMWILFGAYCFSAAYHGMGANQLMQNVMQHIPGGPWGTIIFIQLIIFVLAMVLDPAGIMMITVPVFLPIVKAHGFDPLWFAVIFLLNMEMSTTSPPFGLSLFVMKSVAPPDTTMASIYRAALPFLCLDVVAIALIIAFPALALWLPNIMY